MLMIGKKWKIFKKNLLGVDLGLGSIVRRGMEAKSRGSGFGLAFGLGDECGFGADNIDSLGVLCG